LIKRDLHMARRVVFEEQSTPQREERVVLARTSDEGESSSFFGGDTKEIILAVVGLVVVMQIFRAQTAGPPGLLGGSSGGSGGGSGAKLFGALTSWLTFFLTSAIAQLFLFLFFFPGIRKYIPFLNHFLNEALALEGEERYDDIVRDGIQRRNDRKKGQTDRTKAKAFEDANKSSRVELINQTGEDMLKIPQERVARDMRRVNSSTNDAIKKLSAASAIGDEDGASIFMGSEDLNTIRDLIKKHAPRLLDPGIDDPDKLMQAAIQFEYTDVNRQEVSSDTTDRMNELHKLHTRVGDASENFKKHLASVSEDAKGDLKGALKRFCVYARYEGVGDGCLLSKSTHISKTSLLYKEVGTEAIKSKEEILSELKEEGPVGDHAFNALLNEIEMSLNDYHDPNGTLLDELRAKRAYLKDAQGALSATRMDQSADAFDKFVEKVSADNTPGAIEPKQLGPMVVDGGQYGPAGIIEHITKGKNLTEGLKTAIRNLNSVIGGSNPWKPEEFDSNDLDDNFTGIEKSILESGDSNVSSILRMVDAHKYELASTINARGAEVHTGGGGAGGAEGGGAEGGGGDGELGKDFASLKLE
jgi:hypothetical protein